MVRLPVVILLAAAAGRPLVAQGRDAMEPRSPVILTASRTERLEAVVRLYLQEFIGAIQRADTVALKVLVPADAIPDAEKSVAARVGCASPGAAIARLRAARAGESPHPALPLADVRLENVTIVVGGTADSVARVDARVLERRNGRVRYAPVRVAFVEANGTWQAAVARGALTGLCGLAEAGR